MPDWIAVATRLLVEGKGPLYWTIALITGIVLFLPDPWAAEIGLQQVRADYRGWIGLTFVSTLSLAVVGALQTLISPLYQSVRKALQMQRFRSLILALPADQRAVLLWCLEHHSSEFFAPIAYPPVNSLIDKGLVEGHGFNWYGRWRFSVESESWTRLQAIRGEVRASFLETDLHIIKGVVEKLHETATSGRGDY